MKINNNKEINISSIYRKNNTETIKSKDKTAKPEAAADKIEISTESKGIAKYVDLIKGMPDIRNDKVEEIQNRISSGNYKVSSGELASKMLDAMKEEKEKI